MSENYVSSADKSIEVPFSDDSVEERPDELLADDDAPGVSPAERVSRKQKRTERIKGLLNEGKLTKEENAALKAEREDLKTRLARLEGAVSVQSQQRAAPADGKDKYERALDAAYEKQSEAYMAAQAEIAAGKFDEKRAKHYEKIAREVETDKANIHNQRALDARVPAQRVEQAQQVWVNKYPEVYGNKEAYALAESTFNRRRLLGEQPTHEMVDEIMNEAMARFKLGPKRAPSQNDRARLSGIASSGSGGGSGSAPSGGVPMTKELRRMATALYSDLSEEDAVKKWANGPGKELRKQKVL